MHSDRFRLIPTATPRHIDVIRIADNVRYGTIFKSGNGMWAFLSNHGVTIPLSILAEIRGVVRGMQYSEAH